MNLRHFTLLAFVFLMWDLPSSHGEFLPFRRIAKAAASEESAPAQAKDARQTVELKTALLGEQGLSGLKLGTYVFMEKAFIVGFVTSDDQKQKILTIANGMSFRSVQDYLPTKQQNSTESEAELADDSADSENSNTPAFVAKLKIKEALQPFGIKNELKLSIKVLDKTAVLAGVITDDEVRQAIVTAVQGTDGIDNVVNFMIPVEPGYEKIIQGPGILGR